MSAFAAELGEIGVRSHYDEVSAPLFLQRVNIFLNTTALCGIHHYCIFAVYLVENTEMEVSIFFENVKYGRTSESKQGSGVTRFRLVAFCHESYLPASIQNAFNSSPVCACARCLPDNSQRYAVSIPSGY